MSGIVVVRMIAALGLLAATEGPPSKRVAVLIVPVASEDGELAANLAEVVISELADLGFDQTVGTREVRRFLERDPSCPGAAGCARDSECLRRLSAALAADRIIAGTLRRREGGFVLEVELVDPDSGAAERRVERMAEPGIDSLIHATQEGVAALFAPAAAPPSPRLNAPPERASTVMVERPAGRPRRRWVPHVAYGSAAVSALSFAGAGIFGTLAAADPAGPTRAAAQRDLELREGYATTANVLLFVGAALAAVSTAVFIVLRRDVSGD
jgi:hypothetical protein